MSRKMREIAKLNIRPAITYDGPPRKTFKQRLLGWAIVLLALVIIIGVNLWMNN